MVAVDRIISSAQHRAFYRHWLEAGWRAADEHRSAFSRRNAGFIAVYCGTVAASEFGGKGGRRLICYVAEQAGEKVTSLMTTFRDIAVECAMVRASGI